MAIQVAVIDPHEVYRRGMVSCLADNQSTEVIQSSSDGPVNDAAGVVITDPMRWQDSDWDIPVILCTADAALLAEPPDRDVAAVLDRTTLTPAQLVAAVHAASAGLSVSPRAHSELEVMDERSEQILRMLAEGAATRDISEALGFSQRTIKSDIQRLERSLGARNRAHAVAVGIRRGLI